MTKPRNSNGYNFSFVHPLYTKSVDVLNQELKASIEKEDYETSGRIRDELIRRETVTEDKLPSFTFPVSSEVANKLKSFTTPPHPEHLIRAIIEKSKRECPNCLYDNYNDRTTCFNCFEPLP